MISLDLTPSINPSRDFFEGTFVPKGRDLEVDAFSELGGVCLEWTEHDGRELRAFVAATEVDIHEDFGSVMDAVIRGYNDPEELIFVQGLPTKV